MNSNNVYQPKYEYVNKHCGPIHWSVQFGENVRLGENVVIDKGCIIGNNVFIGHNTVIRENTEIGTDSVIGHLVVIESDTVIGDYVTIQSQCHITKYVMIEDNVFFGPKAMCINTNRISHGREFDPKLEGPHIKFGARIGSGSVLMPGVIIGQEALIGAHSTVTKNCNDFGVYIGSPATLKRYVPEEERYVANSLLRA